MKDEPVILMNPSSLAPLNGASPAVDDIKPDRTTSPEMEPQLNKDLCRQVRVVKRDYTSSHLCNKCDNIFRSWPEFLERIFQEPVMPVRAAGAVGGYYTPSGVIVIPHWEDVLLFKESVTQGCHLCNQLSHEIQKGELPMLGATASESSTVDESGCTMELYWEENSMNRQLSLSPLEALNAASDYDRRCSRTVVRLRLEFPSKVQMYGVHVDKAQKSM